jgi:hypothetical protein
MAATYRSEESGRLYSSGALSYFRPFFPMIAFDAPARTLKLERSGEISETLPFQTLTTKLYSAPITSATRH